MLVAALLASACSGGSKHATATAAPTPVAAAPTANAPTAGPTPASLADEIGVRAHLPIDDPIDLAARYGRTHGRAPASKPFAGEPAIGSTRQFTVVKLSGTALAGNAPPLTVTITATLMVTSAHAHFYEDSSLNVDQAAVQQAADKFESTVWPKVTSVYGDPPTPGVDGDPRIIVLQADLGDGTNGYYSSDDAYLKSVRPLSNEAEMVYMNRTLTAGGDGFNVVLAHELQHLIHARNPDEEAWVNEGLSESASGLVGGAVSSMGSYAAQPQTQLNDFEGGSLPHYGAAASFLRYVASRFGGDASLGVMAREPRHGEAGVDAFLASAGTPLRFPDVFADWITANVLNAPSGPYSNPGWPIRLSISNDLGIGSSQQGETHQFGTDYYNVTGLDGGNFDLKVQGSPTVAVLPTRAPDGAPVYWGNAEDNIDTTLTRDVDLTAASAPVLTFKTWFDVEHWYDWGYVCVSTDGGATWTALPGAQTSTDDPAKAAYGPGYTGESGGGATASWVDERINLSAYAGKKIQLRFEYVTDQAVHYAGWAIEDVAISGTSLNDPTLTDPGWRANGWVRIDNAQTLPQTYVVRLIETHATGAPTVLDVPVDASGNGDLRFNGAGIDSATLAVAGSTEGTSLKAAYSVDLERAQ